MADNERPTRRAWNRNWGCETPACSCLTAPLVILGTAAVGVVLLFPLFAQGRSTGEWWPVYVLVAALAVVFILVGWGLWRAVWSESRGAGVNHLRTSPDAVPSLRALESGAMEDCIFCKIAAGDIPAEKLHEDDQVVAFRDLHPQAPVHFLVIPRRHLTNLSAAEAADAALLGHMGLIAAQVAAQQGLAEAGYRVITNVGPEAGQSVDHLHFHVLGGRHMTWPPG